MGKLEGMSEESVFTKIIAREIPAKIVVENDRIIAFEDISPQAQCHVLVVPKTEKYANVEQLAAAEPLLLAEMISLARPIAIERGNGDYRLVFNTGEKAGQTVHHVHMHVLSGPELSEESIA